MVVFSRKEDMTGEDWSWLWDVFLLLFPLILIVLVGTFIVVTAFHGGDE